MDSDQLGAIKKIKLNQQTESLTHLEGKKGQIIHRLQNSPYFCVFKYVRAVKQKVWNEAENRERDWGETLKIRFFFSRLTCEARALHAHKTLMPRFTDFFTDFEKKTDYFAV